MNTRKLRYWFTAILAFALAGCASKALPSSGPRAPTSPQAVKLYQKPPYRYERLGLVSVPVDADVKWDASGNSDAGFDRLKEEAARRGANGLLLQVDRSQYDGRVLVGYHFTDYQVPYKDTTPRTAVAEAIYVVKE
jgi:hypothetical protein